MTPLPAIRRQAIWGTFIGGCESAQLPDWWQHLPAAPAFVRLPEDIQSLLTNLHKAGTVDELQRAGLVSADEGTLTLDAQVLQMPMWVIQDAPNNQLHGVIANLQAVGQTDWPVALALRDPAQAALLTDRGQPLVVAYSQADLAILRSLGIAAIPGDDWRHLTREQWQFLTQILHIPKSLPHFVPDDAFNRREEVSPRELVFANWNLAMLDSADRPLAAASAQWLHNIAENLEVPSESFLLWKPSLANLESIRISLRYGDTAQVRDAVLRSVESDIEQAQLYAASSRERPPPPTLVEHYRAWRAATRYIAGRPDRKPSLANLLDLADQQWFDRLLENACQTDSVPEQTLLTVLAETSRAHFTTSIAMTEMLRIRLLEQGPDAALPTKQEFNAVMALTDRIWKCVCELRQFQPRTQVVPNRCRSQP